MVVLTLFGNNMVGGAVDVFLETVARLDESGTIPSKPRNGCVIISKKTSAAPIHPDYAQCFFT